MCDALSFEENVNLEIARSLERRKKDCDLENGLSTNEINV